MSVLLSRAVVLSFVLSIAGSAMAQTSPASADDAAPSRAQASTAAPRPGQHEVYVGWGYNADRYANEDIEFTQPSLGNLFTLHDVVFHDSKGWTTGLLSKSLTGPEYNFQLGYYVRPSLAVELNSSTPRPASPRASRCVCLAPWAGCLRTGPWSLTLAR